jgi:hypothetical protein
MRNDPEQSTVRVLQKSDGRYYPQRRGFFAWRPFKGERYEIADGVAVVPALAASLTLMPHRASFASVGCAASVRCLSSATSRTPSVLQACGTRAARATKVDMLASSGLEFLPELLHIASGSERLLAGGFARVNNATATVHTGILNSLSGQVWGRRIDASPSHL